MCWTSILMKVYASLGPGISQVEGIWLVPLRKWGRTWEWISTNGDQLLEEQVKMILFILTFIIKQRSNQQSQERWILQANWAPSGLQVSFPVHLDMVESFCFQELHMVGYLVECCFNEHPYEATSKFMQWFITEFKCSATVSHSFCTI